MASKKFIQHKPIDIDILLNIKEPTWLRKIKEEWKSAYTAYANSFAKAHTFKSAEDFIAWQERNILAAFERAKERYRNSGAKQYDIWVDWLSEVYFGNLRKFEELSERLRIDVLDTDFDKKYALLKNKRNKYDLMINEYERTSLNNQGGILTQDQRSAIETARTYVEEWFVKQQIELYKLLEPEKRRAQIELDYNTEKAAIDEMAAKWKEAQGGTLTEDQSEQITKAYELAQSKMEKSIEEMEAEEVAKSREKIEKLLDQYKDFDQRRRDIDNAYTADMETLNAEKERLEKAGLDTADIESSIHARTEAYHNEIKDLQNEILQSTAFYDKLFGDVSTKGYKILKDFYGQAQEVMNSATTTKDGVELTIIDKDADGKTVKKQVKVTVEEFEKMKKRVIAIKNELEKKNPFAAFHTSWKDLTKAMREGGDVTGALQGLNTKGKEVTQTIRGWGDSLGAVFGDRFKKSMNEIMDFCDGAMNMGTGIAQIWSGDIVGGITSALSGLSSIISLFTGWKEKMEEMKRKWYIAEIETNRALREQAEAYAANQSKISDIIDDVETLNWLIEKGYAKPGSVSVWQAQSDALKQYMEDLKAETKVRDELWEKLQGSEAHYEWGNSLNGGSATWSLRGLEAEEIQLLYEQDKLSDAAKEYYEAWVDSDKAVKDLVKEIEDCYAAMQEMVMGVSFDSFLGNARDALKEMRKDISSLGDFTEETLANAILNAFMYQALADMLQPLYDELSEALINGTADAAYLEEWRRRFEETMQDANDRLDMIEKATGVDLDYEGGSSQSGRAGSFNAMSQDQGTKLEGLFTSGQIHWANMDSELEDVASKMNKALEHLMGIEENTGKSAKSLNEILEELRSIIRDGLKVK